jgi:hypothetical protein
MLFVFAAVWATLLLTRTWRFVVPHRRHDPRLGTLPHFFAARLVRARAALSAPEEDRGTRLLQLGEARTCRVHNCGKILHVDYDRGELIVERHR